MCLGSPGDIPRAVGTDLEWTDCRRLHAESFPHLSIWHGINLKLIISLGIFGAGFIIFAFLVGNKYLFTFSLPRFMRLDIAFDRALDRLPYAARKITFFLRSNQPFDYLLIVVSFFVFCAGGL